jgi:hypothetical protein
MRETTREQFIEEEVEPVAKKRFERSLILDEIVRTEKLEVDDASLDAEFNQTLGALTQQGLDLNKVKGGKKGQQELAQAVAMESANRVLTRRALEMLKSIAVGEYKTPEERQAEAEAEAKKAAEAAEKAVEEAVAEEKAEPEAVEEATTGADETKAADPVEETAEEEPAEAEENAPEAEADSKSDDEPEEKSAE